MLFACVRACRAAAARGHVRAHSAVTSVARSPLKDALTLADASSLHPETKRLLDGILAGDRMSLARGITLSESAASISPAGPAPQRGGLLTALGPLPPATCCS